MDEKWSISSSGFLRSTISTKDLKVLKHNFTPFNIHFDDVRKQYYVTIIILFKFGTIFNDFGPYSGVAGVPRRDPDS